MIDSNKQEPLNNRFLTLDTHTECGRLNMLSCAIHSSYLGQWCNKMTLEQFYSLQPGSLVNFRTVKKNLYVRTVKFVLIVDTLSFSRRFSHQLLVENYG